MDDIQGIHGIHGFNMLIAKLKRVLVLICSTFYSESNTNLHRRVARAKGQRPKAKDTLKTT